MKPRLATFACALVLAGCSAYDDAGAGDAAVDSEPGAPETIEFVTDSSPATADSEAETAVEAEVDLDAEPDAAPDIPPDVPPDTTIDCGGCDDGLACTDDVCGPDGICRHPVAAGACLVDGVCLVGGEGEGPCRVCAPEVSQQDLTALTGGSCDDGDRCTRDDQCSDGVCQGGEEVTCKVSSACHLSLGCDPDEGCLEELRPDGTPCGDGQMCSGGACVTGDGMPPGTIAWFDATTCPNGWTAHTPAVGRTLVPVGEAGPAGGVFEDGTPLASGAEPTHFHVASGSVELGRQRFAGVAGGGNPLAAPGTVAVTGTSAPSALGLPYLQLRACRKTASEILGRPPRGVLILAERCDDGWTANGEGADRLVVGVPEGGVTGATFGAAAGLAERPTHHHTVSGTMTIPSRGIALLSGCCSSDFASAADRPVSLVSEVQSSTEGTTFPWRAERQCLAPAAPDDGDARPDTAPAGIVLAARGATCPEGWSAYRPARGRLIVGAATGRDVGVTVGTALGDREDRTHRHAIGLTIDLTPKNIAAANGGNHDGAAPGAHTTTLTSAPASSGLPFRQILWCAK